MGRAFRPAKAVGPVGAPAVSVKSRLGSGNSFGSIFLNRTIGDRDSAASSAPSKHGLLPSPCYAEAFFFILEVNTGRVEEKPGAASSQAQAGVKKTLPVTLTSTQRYYGPLLPGAVTGGRHCASCPATVPGPQRVFAGAPGHWSPAPTLRAGRGWHCLLVLDEPPALHQLGHLVGGVAGEQEPVARLHLVGESHEGQGVTAEGCGDTKGAGIPSEAGGRARPHQQLSCLNKQKEPLPLKPSAAGQLRLKCTWDSTDSAVRSVAWTL